ncbi:hypothetical protein FACS189447_00940 [Spirochaetia bacterium]|nr:hypothetical protein FACS189447_00940 [Spirochaetia bacterium]
MNTKEYVASLFADYEETTELAEFKEELQTNLDDRIKSLVQKDMNEQDAFNKATTELGDISALADELSLKKRREVFEDAYLGIRKYMKSRRVAAYVLAGASVLFGIVSALLVFLAMDTRFVPEALQIHTDIRLTAFFATLMFFTVIGACLFTFLGTTQETASRYPMTIKRGLWYTLAALLLSLGITLFPLTYYATGGGLMEALATLIPFVLPGIGLLVFLVLTEKNHLKPWVTERISEETKRAEELWKNPALAARFGMFSGAIWILAIGLFVLLGLLMGFQYSWFVFVLAVAGELVLQGVMIKSKGETK